jgi:hypothetical protein
VLFFAQKRCSQSIGVSNLLIVSNCTGTTTITVSPPKSIGVSNLLSSKLVRINVQTPKFAASLSEKLSLVKTVVTYFEEYSDFLSVPVQATIQEKNMNTTSNTTQVGLMRSPRLRSRENTQEGALKKTRVKRGAVKKNKAKLPFDLNAKTDTMKNEEVLALFQASGVEITEELQQLIGS